MPRWVEEARRHLGQREALGPASNGWIRDLWLSLKGGAWFWDHYGRDDSKLPWCGAFVAGCLQRCAIAYPAKYASALAWLEWGVETGPGLGAVAVIKRQGGGHVGFVTGITTDGRYVRLLGGNQDDGVSEAWFVAERIVGYRAPAGHELGGTVFANVGTMNRSEA